MKYRKSIIRPEENIIMLKSKNNDGIVPHSHEFIELVYISSGKGIHNIKGKSYMVSAGDLFIICTQDNHSLYPLSEETIPFQWINCIFLPKFIGFDLSVFPPECRYIGTEGFETNFIFQSMLQEFQEKKPGYLDILRGYLIIVLTKLARLIAAEAANGGYTDMKRQKYLKKAVEYIHQNYQEEISLHSISAYLSVSPSHIGKMFRELQGISPVSYIIKYRVEQSCRVLLETSLPVNRVAGEAGFKDVKFYYTVFKRLMGISPGEFRSKYKC